LPQTAAEKRSSGPNRGKIESANYRPRERLLCFPATKTPSIDPFHAGTNDRWGRKPKKNELGISFCCQHCVGPILFLYTTYRRVILKQQGNLMEMHIQNKKAKTL